MSAESLPIHPDWKRRSLGDVADITLGGTPSTDVRGYWGGTIPWMSSGEVNKKRVFEADGRITEAGLAASNATLIDPPTVAVGLAGQGKTRGTVALVNIRVSTNQSIALIKGREGQLDTYYLFHNLDGRYDELRTRSAGGGRAGLSREILAAVPIGLPDVAEQSRIALVLDTVDEAIARTEAVIAKLRQVRAGLLHDLLTRGLDSHGQLRDPIAHPEQFQPSPLGQIPKEWEVCLLDDVAIRGSGHTPSKDVPSYWNGGIKWVSLADSDKLDRIYIFETDKEISELGIENSSAVKHQAGTVVLSRDAGIGKSAILAQEMAVSQHFMAWRCGKQLHNVFLYYWLQQNKSRFEAIAMGSTIKTIGLTYFKRLQIAVPQFDEQQTAANAMLASEAAISAEEVELRKLHQLKSGLMTDLLSGRVRVPLPTGGTA